MPIVAVMTVMGEVATIVPMSMVAAVVVPMVVPVSVVADTDAHCRVSVPIPVPGVPERPPRTRIPPAAVIVVIGAMPMMIAVTVPVTVAVSGQLQCLRRVAHLSLRRRDRNSLTAHHSDSAACERNE